MSRPEQVWPSDLLVSPHDTADKRVRVRRMFNAIAPRYEWINALFSAGRDAAWRRRAVALAHITPADRVLDVACGTGDFARAFARACPRSVVGCDFAHAMLVRAGDRPTERAVWCEADALRLPFDAGRFTAVSCAFGVRNFADLDAGLREMYRVLAPGGRVVILEFTRPKHRVARGLYELYAHRVMPRAAGWLSGDATGAYRYLPRSVVSFLSAEQMCARLRGVGFTRPSATPLTMGVVTVYQGTKRAS